jgi:hypothetical protein
VESIRRPPEQDKPLAKIAVVASNGLR